MLPTISVVTLTLLTVLARCSAIPYHTGLEEHNTGITTIFQFSEKDRWFENLVVRSNDMILATELTSPNLWLIDPRQGFDGQQATPELVHRFPEYLGLLGIVEYRPDVFAFIAGNFSISEGFISEPGSYAIWSIDFTNSDGPVTKKIADVPGAKFLNGLAYLESADALLLGDAGLGVIWKLSISTGCSSIVIEDPLMKKVNPDAPDGINGLKVYGHELWFTRGFQSLVAKVRVSAQGEMIAAPEVIGIGSNSTWTMDDLVVDTSGQAYVAIPFQNLIARYGPVENQPVLIAGNINSTVIAEPTSLAFSRAANGVLDENVLYVATGGAIADPIDGTITVGGQIVKIEL